MRYQPSSVHDSRVTPSGPGSRRTCGADRGPQPQLGLAPAPSVLDDRALDVDQLRREAAGHGATDRPRGLGQGGGVVQHDAVSVWPQHSRIWRWWRSSMSRHVSTGAAAPMILRTGLSASSALGRRRPSTARMVPTKEKTAASVSRMRSHHPKGWKPASTVTWPPRVAPRASCPARSRARAAGSSRPTRARRGRPSPRRRPGPTCSRRPGSTPRPWARRWCPRCT